MLLKTHFKLETTLDQLHIATKTYVDVKPQVVFLTEISNLVQGVIGSKYSGSSSTIHKEGLTTLEKVNKESL